MTRRSFARRVAGLVAGGVALVFGKGEPPEQDAAEFLAEASSRGLRQWSRDEAAIPETYTTNGGDVQVFTAHVQGADGVWRQA